MKKFERKTMKDYHNLNLNCDILLLADVFEKFKNNNLTNNKKNNNYRQVII